MDEHEHEAPPARKGRGNAILTYETVDDIKTQLTRVIVTLESITANQDRHDAGHKDHESRLRVLEAQLIGFMAGATATRTTQVEAKGDFKWAWAALFTIIGAGFSLAGFFIKH
ncbi:hypothetical protein [Methylobacterium marchantiae]|uniref:DUF1515 domain-containing protein n=1 Tax=Methylobacterium marchantiae TaxID=600331 RepID=A0ABW3X1Y4_9HYPH|nr:hypothetical protein AIGOOFII_3482 [Methylobacterium marchantiae]